MTWVRSWLCVAVYMWSLLHQNLIFSLIKHNQILKYLEYVTNYIFAEMLLYIWAATNDYFAINPSNIMSSDILFCSQQKIYSVYCHREKISENIHIAESGIKTCWLKMNSNWSIDHKNSCQLIRWIVAALLHIYHLISYFGKVNKQLNLLSQ